jgi:hypothetical protein
MNLHQRPQAISIFVRKCQNDLSPMLHRIPEVLSPYNDSIVTKYQNDLSRMLCGAISFYIKGLCHMPLQEHKIKLWFCVDFALGRFRIVSEIFNFDNFINIAWLSWVCWFLGVFFSIIGNKDYDSNGDALEVANNCGYERSLCDTAKTSDTVNNSNFSCFKTRFFSVCNDNVQTTRNFGTE